MINTLYDCYVIRYFIPKPCDNVWGGFPAYYLIIRMTRVNIIYSKPTSNLNIYIFAATKVLTLKMGIRCYNRDIRINSGAIPVAVSLKKDFVTHHYLSLTDGKATKLR